ncbi:NUDIX hydrolase [Chryseolinea lacunae]|uniref:NUDIX hydrolase n=1 Tax=Chryseolinea lacunae TaxID=2801331 RepID=A0ABS1KT97_9BACT|nr:NUDIX hydrolase [Chryseolinea lacunae]MBL0742487.1 NUDIX hydrolase [Chryseolinea lacunae]
MPHDAILTLVERIKSIADVGLLYAKDPYDRERYSELQEITHAFHHTLTGVDIDTLKQLYVPAKDYPTAKVDIRGLLLAPDNKVLLVKESADGKWSLPGGWADVGYSPREVIVKEFKEETGLDVSAERLLALFDKKMHPHPVQPFYVYKVAFLCRALSHEIQKGFDVLDVQYFDMQNLPELSSDRILKSQLEILFKHAMATNTSPYFD